MTDALWIASLIGGTVLIVLGAELFAEHLAGASARLGLSAFALAVLLAGAEPEELGTVVTASARGVDGVAFGDIIGANAAIVTVALGVGAVVAALPFGRRIQRYALGGLAAALFAAPIIWDGRVSRLEGAVLVTAYLVFVGWIWKAERQPPALGETAELNEERDTDGPIGRDLILVLGGLIALTGGSMILVESVRQLSSLEDTQTRLGLIVVGFATAFELVVLAWSAGRRGMPEAAVAGVIGSFAYNLTMSLGAGALVAPIQIADATIIRVPYAFMAMLMVVVVMVGSRFDRIGRRFGLVLLSLYPVFVVVSLVA